MRCPISTLIYADNYDYLKWGFTTLGQHIVYGEPWFVGKDVVTVLGYANPSKAVSNHVDSEDKRMEMIAHSQNGNVVTQTALINESGLYSLVLSSKFPTSWENKKSKSTRR